MHLPWQLEYSAEAGGGDAVLGQWTKGDHEGAAPISVCGLLIHPPTDAENKFSLQ